MNSNEIRPLESDPIAVAKHANQMLAAVREGRVSGNPEMVKESLYRYASQIEGFDPHLATNLEAAAERL